MGIAVGLDKERVLAEATAWADAEGIEALTLSGLASRLGIRPQSIYVWVDGLEGLRRDLAVRGHGMLAERLRRAAMARTGGEALRALATAYAGFAADHPGLYACSLRQPDGDDEVEASVAAASEPWHAVLASFGITPTEIIHHHRIVWAALHGFVSLRQQGLMTRAASIERSFHLLVDVFVTDLEGRGRPRQPR